jgi:pimeloyl-ACP methyl ester carboxylesterase
VSFTRGRFLSLAAGGFHGVSYLDWGRAASDHVVVCIHGLARNCRDFDFLAASLAQQCRVVCMDVAGRGDSEWLADKADYRFSTYLADSAVLLARITAPAPHPFFEILRGRGSERPAPRRIDWVGTSMGGLIGMLLAAKPGSPITRLVLNDVGAFTPWSALVRLKGYVGAAQSFRSLDEVEAHLRRTCAQFGPLSDAHWRHLATHGACASAAGDYRLRYDPGIGATLRGHADPEFPLGPGLLAGIDLWNTWKAVRCPTLVLRGEHSDVLSRETLAQMRALRPDTEVVEFGGVGHAPALMSEAQIEAVRRFLLS